ncbi:hypothetical protein [Methylomagnum sp.]
MKTLVPLLVATALLTPVMADANPVYRCVRNGQAIFTDEADDASCKPVNLQVVEPNPGDVARALEKKHQQAEQERLQREADERDAVIRAQVDAARAAERLAEEQRRQVKQQATRDAQRQANPYWYQGYGPGYGYPPSGHRLYPPAYPRPIPAPITTPARPSTPNYPYGPDRATVGR